MQVLPITRAQESYGGYSFSFSTSDGGTTTNPGYTAFGNVGGLSSEGAAGGVAYSATSWSFNGTTSNASGTTIRNGNGHAETSVSFGGRENHYTSKETFGYTYQTSTRLTAPDPEGSDTITTTTISFSTITGSSSSDLSTFDNSGIVPFTVASGYTSALNVTSNIPLVHTYYSVSDGNLFSSTKTTNGITNASTNGTQVTVSTSLTFVGVSTSWESINAPIEYGAIVVADTDWLWSFDSAGGGGYSFITDFGVSFTRQTFWGAKSMFVTNYTTYDGTNEFPVDGNAETFTFQYYDTYTTTTNVTQGGSFPRETTSTETTKGSLASSTTSFGFTDYTISAAATEGFTLTTTNAVTTSVSTLTFDGIGFNSTTLSSFKTQSTTTNGVFTPIPGFGDNSAVVPVGVAWEQLPQSVAALASVPPQGVYISPNELQAGGNLEAYGRNLRLGGATIYYPFTAGLNLNVAVPIKSQASATDSDSITWRYTWNGPSLSYRKQNSSSFTDGSGVFSTLSAISDEYVAPAALGGYQMLSDEPVTIRYTNRAVVGTSIAPDGASTTFQTLETSSASTTMKGTLLVQQELPAFKYWTTEGGNTPFMAFERNKLT